MTDTTSASPSHRAAGLVSSQLDLCVSLWGPAVSTLAFLWLQGTGIVQSCGTGSPGPGRWTWCPPTYRRPSGTAGSLRCCRRSHDTRWCVLCLKSCSVKSRARRCCVFLCLLCRLPWTSWLKKTSKPVFLVGMWRTTSRTTHCSFIKTV